MVTYIPSIVGSLVQSPLFAAQILLMIGVQSCEIRCLLRSIPMINGWKFRENPWNSHLHWLTPSCFNVFFLVNSPFFSGKIWKNPHPLLHVLHLQRHRFAIEGISPTQHDEEHRTQAAAREAADGSDIWGIEPPTIEINRVYSWDNFGYYLFFNVFIHILSIPRPSLIALFGSHL